MKTLSRAASFTRHALFSLIVGGALVVLAGCGKNNGATASGPAPTPATAEQAARVLDLSTIALVDGAKAPWPRPVAGLSYAATSNVKTAFEFHRKKLLADGWKELPNSSVMAESASAMFAREGFVVSLSTYSSGQSGTVAITLQNHGNVRPGQLPTPSGVKPVYVGDSAAMYVTEAAVPATAEAVRTLLVSKGWTPYGDAGDSVYYKQNAVLVTATVSSAPAQGGKTMISYNCELISADIPAPPDVTDLRYTDSNQELNFATSATKDDVIAFYRKALAPAKWEATLDHVVQIDDNDTMIFRNPAKDMLTLTMPTPTRTPLRVNLHFQSGAEIAELDRQLKERAPALRAAAEAKEKAEAARLAEANKPPPKIPVTLPADAKDVSEGGGEIKFTVAHGKAKAVAAELRKQFLAAGWKEDVASLDDMAGALSLSKEKQSLSINYTDTGFLPTEITISSMRGELERR